MMIRYIGLGIATAALSSALGMTVGQWLGFTVGSFLLVWSTDDG